MKLNHAELGNFQTLLSANTVPVGLVQIPLDAIPHAIVIVNHQAITGNVQLFQKKVSQGIRLDTDYQKPNREKSHISFASQIKRPKCFLLTKITGYSAVQ